MATIEKRKLMIIGIDGGNSEVLNNLMSKKVLPNLENFKNKGILKSTIPPGTAVAWSSFSTGNNPGKTGIYDFTIVKDNSWKISFVNRKELHGKPLWEYLNENGIKSGFMNIPITYPPDEINGVIISGIDAPSTLSDYTTPVEIKDRLREFDYEIEASGIGDRNEMVKHCIEIVDKRVNAAKMLLKEDFDFFIILFRESDIAQHFAWGSEEVEEIYKKIDSFIGEMRSSWNGDIIVMSDHGEEKVEKAFNMNSWLEQEGYLTTTNKKPGIISKVVNREKIYKVLDSLNAGFLTKMVPRSLAKKIPTKEIDFEEAILTGVVDLTKTKAIAKRAVKTAQIFINTVERGGIVKEEEKEGLITSICYELNKFFIDNKIQATVSSKDVLYGKEAENAPEITVYFDEKGYDFLTSFPTGELWGETKEQATHIVNGILFTDLELGLENANIIDMAPTILQYFGLNGEFDGRSLI